MKHALTIKGKTFVWGERAYVMGILNLTSDSFSGDGLGVDFEKIVTQARTFAEHGADLLDIGGESTNPYHSSPVTAEEELRRVIPAIRAIVAVTDLPISIDTYKPEVASAALEAGADIINDIHGLEDTQMQELAAITGAPVIAMHMRGTPATMQQMTDYNGDVVGALFAYFKRRISELEVAGIALDKLIIDPGFGFAKTIVQNYELLNNLPIFKTLGLPLLVGVSRKGFIGRGMVEPGQEPPPPQDRILGTAAAVALAIANGADIVRVHDVAEMMGVVRLANAITRS
ncbi:MAG: dihydropteroate synthase [Chloroflexi bacterium]|uniref:dihydropteroate synthase n=1 Tax=Candidatus Chlorohelix allophototropha TaxID=3003348 RepID=A0A8T7M5R3_9CHLR|nr:dihydropteroate synthase [Chloroflexota bacterium]WJW69369.1 dihydropteroate synthase [Chloroflexota bacterium L227-S17]